ncbi:MAG: ABC transporter permease [Minwuiales bacterium]|nr:ABC transporter permease [Minwuiales bacterium]
MNLFTLSLSYIRARALNSALNLLLLALGIATITVLILFSAQLESRLTKDARGIDLVVGAKGSPMQLILSSIYHVDIPTGNIPYASIATLRRNPMVDGVVPLALGDSFSGFRMVGSEHSYAALYDAELADGALWDRPFEATLGATVAEATGLAIGDSFFGSHGIADAGGPVHDDRPYRVVGILQPTGSVLDRLVLTSVESVWFTHDAHHHEDEHAHDDHDHDEREDEHAHEEDEHAHDDHDHDEHEHEDEHAHEEDEHAHEDEEHAHGDHKEEHADDDHGHDEHGHDEHEGEEHAHDEHEGEEHGHDEAEHAAGADLADREITALLVSYRSPIAAVSLPRQINSQSALQAAAPAFETARLLALVGVGLDTLRGFGLLLIFTAALGVFIALYNAMQQRRYDLAVMRSLGATPGKLLRQVILEGLILSLAGAALGLALGHGVAEILGRVLREGRDLGLTGLAWQPAEWSLIILSIFVGIIASVIPAIQAYRTDIAATLSTR